MPSSMAIWRARRLTAAVCLRLVTIGMRPSGGFSHASMVGSSRAGARWRSLLKSSATKSAYSTLFSVSAAAGRNSGSASREQLFSSSL